MKVFFYEAFEEEAERLRHYLPDDIEAGFTSQTIQEYGAETPPAPIISVRTQSDIPIVWGDTLEAILTRSTGYDHIRRYREACGREVPGGCLPLYCHRAVAEQAMLMWMALLRKLRKQTGQFRTFYRDGITGGEAQGKTLVVVGVGNIGHEVARIGRGLDMKVIGVDIDPRHEDITYESIEEAIVQANIIACCMNLTPENRGYFTEELLMKAPRGMIFVNVSRGELSPCRELLPLIESGHLAGMALDVYDEESRLAGILRDGKNEVSPETEATLKLAEMENVIFTPHNAFNTVEAVDRKSSQSIEQLIHLREHGEFKWPIP